MATWTDTTTLKLLIGESSSSYDTHLGVILNAVETNIIRYLGYNPAGAAGTEYYSGNGSNRLVLARNPVTAVSAVYEDTSGYYGVPSDVFDATASVLTAGTDYVWDKEDVNKAGVLIRLGGKTWPLGQKRFPDRLANSIDYVWGCVKVTYTAGMDATQVSVITEAAYLEAAALFQSRVTGMGAFASQGLDGYNYSISSAEGVRGKSGNSRFLSPVVELMLRPWRRVAIATRV